MENLFIRSIPTDPNTGVMPMGTRFIIRIPMDTGKLIHEKASDGCNKWYDANGKLIHKKFADKSKEWYDANGKCVHVKDSNGADHWWDYDSHGNITLIRKNSSDGSEWLYDANRQLVNIKVMPCIAPQYVSINLKVSRD